MSQKKILRKAVKFFLLTRIENYKDQFLSVLESYKVDDQNLKITQLQKNIQQALIQHCQNLPNYSNLEHLPEEDLEAKISQQAASDLTKVMSIVKKTIEESDLPPSLQNSFLNCKPIRMLQTENCLEFFKALRTGCCVGLAVCHAAMDLHEIGQLTEWEEKLATIAEWNECPKSIGIMNSSADARKLRGLMEETIITFASNQGVLPAEFNLHHDLRNLLSAKKEDGQNYFEMSVRDKKDGKHKLKTILSSARIVGKTRKILTYITPGMIQNKICIINGMDHMHTIRLGYKNDQWIFYDANMEHTKKTAYSYKVPT